MSATASKSDFHFRCTKGHTFTLSLTAQQFIDLDHPCKCGAAARRYVPISLADHETTMKAMERSREYRNQSNIESKKLPWGMKHKAVHSYGPNGEPRFVTRKDYIEAGRSVGMAWQ